MVVNSCGRTQPSGSHLRHGVRRLRLLSPDGRVRRQCDSGGRVSGPLGPLDADGGRRRVDGQSRTSGRKHWQHLVHVEEVWKRGENCMAAAAVASNNLVSLLDWKVVHIILYHLSHLGKKQQQQRNPSYPWATSAECVTVGLITGDWVLEAEMGATTVGSTAVDVVTAGRDCGARGRYRRRPAYTLNAFTLNIAGTWIVWWMMCCTVAWPGPALAPVAGRRTVLVLDITAAAAAPAV